MNELIAWIDQEHGRTKQIACACGVSSQAVSMWRQLMQVPVRHVLNVEALTGISRHVLRPDIYPEDDNPRRKT